MLNLSDKTVTKAFKQLNECKLIHEKKQGSTKPNLIYVGKIEHDEDLTKVIRKNYESRIVKSPTHDTENLRPNNTNNKNTNRVKGKRPANFEQRNYDGFDFDTLLANYKEII